MTEIPEHLRRRAEEARRHALGETYPPFSDTQPKPEPLVRHEVATVITSVEWRDVCRIVCTCGWVSEKVWIDGITVAFHQHAHGRT